MMRTADIYRDHHQGLAIRFEALTQRLARQLDEITTDVELVHRRRLARAAAGATGVAAVVALVSLELVTFIDRHDAVEGGLATSILVLGWAAAAAVYLVVRLAAHARLRAVIARALRPSGDMERDLERLERLAPDAPARIAADRLERASVALPLMGLALLAPLTIHWLVYVVANLGDLSHTHHFDEWIAMSLVIVGHAHLVLAFLAYRFATKLRRSAAADPAAAPGKHGWIALAFTTLAGAVPGIVLFAIPPVLVAVTGLVFVPLGFYAVGRRALAERGPLGIAPSRAGL